MFRKFCIKIKSGRTKIGNPESQKSGNTTFFFLLAVITTIYFGCVFKATINCCYKLTTRRMRILKLLAHSLVETYKYIEKYNIFYGYTFFASICCVPKDALEALFSKIFLSSRSAEGFLINWLDWETLLKFHRQLIDPWLLMGSSRIYYHVIV